jgi:FdhE protein
MNDAHAFLPRHECGMMAATMIGHAQQQSDRLAQQWDARIARARELQSKHSSAQAVLAFYTDVLQFQRGVSIQADSRPVSDQPLRSQLDLKLATSALHQLFALTMKSGPSAVAARAQNLHQLGDSGRRDLLTNFLAAPVAAVTPDDFFARACLQPIAEALQSQLPSSKAATRTCPVCGGLPQLSILRPEGDGGARWLQCSFCLREWLFRRVVCPWCGEENKDKLPRYSVEECAHIHVSACDVCQRYLKTIDNTIEGRAVPLIDEVAMAALDVWATDHGYTKMASNLMGF